MTRGQQEKIEKHFDELCEIASGLNPSIPDEFRAAMKAAYVAGADYALDAAPCWISVEDELPKTETEVLMVSSGSTDILYGYRSKIGKNRWYCYNDDDFWHNITHWMPIPEPPKKGGEE